MNPDSADAHNKFAAVLVKTGRIAEGTTQLESAVALAPGSVEYRFSLAYVLGMAGRFADAVPQLQKAVELSDGQDWQCFDMLGMVYSKLGRRDDAIQAARKALDLAQASRQDDLVRSLRAKLSGYQESR